MQNKKRKEWENVMKAKKLATFLIATAVMLTMVFTVNTSVLAQDLAVVYAEIPDGWEDPHLWSWGDSGGAFPDWPGGRMEPDANNPGWYFAHVPTDMAYVIISADVDGGREQTADLELEGLPVWVSVTSAEEATLTTSQLTEGDLPIPLTMEVVYAEIPEGWDMPHIWSWGDAGSAFPDWPGGIMAPDPNNPGWYYIHIPSNMGYIIVSADVEDGREQTADLELTGLPVWVSVTSPDEATLSTEKLTDGDIPAYVGELPEPPPPQEDAPETDLITVRAKVPDAWMDPGVWAWNNDYGSVFPSWPGQEFTEVDGDWHVMQIPGWINGIIINAINGGVQTDDIMVEMGRDLWIAVIAGDGSYHYDYAEFDPDSIGEIEDEPLPTLAPAVEFTQPAPVEEEAPSSSQDDDNGGLPGIAVAGIVVAIAAGLGAVVFIGTKKKKG